MQPYTDLYYEALRRGARQSAEIVVPLVLELIRPRSVIDVGCGTGTWLSVFQACGIEEICGIDGEHIDRAMLEIPEECFIRADLEDDIHLDRQFDLVVSLEVAEHLPAECARGFVDSLTRLGSVVLFSAAIPCQRGEHHVNEQWPDYWGTHFLRKDYLARDCIREKVWQNSAVEWWYSQNTFLYIGKDVSARYPLLNKPCDNVLSAQLPAVHPVNYLQLVWTNRLLQLAQDLGTAISSGDTFIFVDQEQIRHELPDSFKHVPFLEKDGCYWGLPPDDETAICEFERLRQGEVKWIVFAWPAFWWLDYYGEFGRYLRSRFRCALKNERLIVFDLGT